MRVAQDFAPVDIVSSERWRRFVPARNIGTSRSAVWRRQLRFAEAGVDWLLRNMSRIPGKPRTPDAAVQRVVQRIQAAHLLQPQFEPTADIFRP